MIKNKWTGKTLMLLSLAALQFLPGCTQADAPQKIDKAPGIEAAIDDGLLNISFRVLSFETVIFDSMGNAMPEVSNGAQFSDRQKAAIKKLSRGKRFYISKVKAIGPDGIERTISPIEVFVN